MTTQIKNTFTKLKTTLTKPEVQDYITNGIWLLILAILFVSAYNSIDSPPVLNPQLDCYPGYKWGNIWLVKHKACCRPCYKYCITAAGVEYWLEWLTWFGAI